VHVPALALGADEARRLALEQPHGLLHAGLEGPPLRREESVRQEHEVDGRRVLGAHVAPQDLRLGRRRRLGLAPRNEEQGERDREPDLSHAVILACSPAPQPRSCSAPESGAPNPPIPIAMSTTAEKHAFQAEVNEVLSLVVHSLYSHREVFLRELVSNASDALDQLNLKALTEPGLLSDDSELRIELLVDKKAGTLTVRDNGVGMTRAELLENLGTIARSGTKKLMQSLSPEQKKDVALIGQFGVGFYSAFLVADTVTVLSRKAAGDGAGDEAWIWESQAKDDFELRPGEREGRGTDVVLHLKDDAKEYLDEWPIREVVRKYSDYVRWPIRLEVARDDGKAEKKEWQTLNAARALWTRPKGEITREQYVEFYKHVSHDWNEPLAWTHFKVEGTHELTGLLFVPAKAPLDLFEQRKAGVRLFVKRIFILDDAQEILPDWLRFVRGVVDSEDLPLNVSREILQRDATTKFIRKQVVAKTLALLEELAKEGETEVELDGKKVKRERYLDFWRAFGRVLKEGIHHDPDRRTELARLLRYESSRGQGLTSLAAYKARMPAEQKAVYYVPAESLAAAEKSPHIEALRKRGFEVLYLVDPIDEWIADTLAEFEGTPLVAASKGALDLPESDEQKHAKEAHQKDLAPVLARMHKVLDARVEAVRVTDRLTDSPACLVSGEHGMSAHLERRLRDAGHAVPDQKRILEINPEHPVIRKLRALADGDDAKFQRWTGLLHDQALLAEGVLPPDPAGFARRIAELMAE
jgi:molecular chaperone HtpG